MSTTNQHPRRSAGETSVPVRGTASNSFPETRTIVHELSTQNPRVLQQLEEKRRLADAFLLTTMEEITQACSFEVEELNHTVDILSLAGFISKDEK